MRSNGLLKWLMIPVAFLVLFVAIRLFSGEGMSAPPVGDADARLTPEEMKALGIEGDTPRDTVATLVAQVKQLRSELQVALSDNKSQREENQRLRQREASIDQRISSALEAERSNLRRDQQQAASERQQTEGLLADLQRRLDSIGGRGDGHADLPVGLGLRDGDEAGMESASMMVKGANAYGLLKSENGVHRLVRVSPFDANARRQTSFASLEVMPELDNTIQVDIRPEDIEMQVYRSSGAGGQHINKTSSAVRLIHKPTGIVVSCQTQRSQFQNRDYAMEMLKAKLYQIAQQQHMDKIEDIKGVQNEIAWGHQIRSYVFMPYTMVKDHRTNYETGNVDAVMDGDLDGFIFAYLKAASRGELQDT